MLNARSTCSLATAAPDPLLDPPGERAMSQGLRQAVGSAKSNSVVTVLPMIHAPAARSAATTGAAYSTGAALAQAALPLHVGKPATSTMSLIPTLSPLKGPDRGGVSLRQTKAWICRCQQAKVSDSQVPKPVTRSVPECCRGNRREYPCPRQPDLIALRADMVQRPAQVPQTIGLAHQIGMQRNAHHQRLMHRLF